MGERPDETADDTSAATAEASTAASPGSGTGSTTEGSTTVAATAGIDEAVLDVSQDLASTVRLQWSIRWAVGAGVVGAIAGVFTFVIGSVATALPGGSRSAATVGVVLFALGTALGIVRAVMLYRSWTYVVRPDSLYLSRGVFTRVRTIVPYVRVQHVDTRRGPLERLLGLSTLVVYTAGSRGADVRIPGLTPDGASTLQRRLERLAIESEEVDAV